jgi:hypothetical protein
MVSLILFLQCHTVIFQTDIPTESIDSLITSYELSLFRSLQVVIFFGSIFQEFISLRPLAPVLHNFTPATLATVDATQCILNLLLNLSFVLPHDLRTVYMTISNFPFAQDRVRMPRKP